MISILWPSSIQKVERGNRLCFSCYHRRLFDAFQAYALNPEVEINAISEIIKDTDVSTTGGYWLYQVTATENMDISDEHMEILTGDALDAWIGAFDYETVVVSENIEEMKGFAAAKVKSKNISIS